MSQTSLPQTWLPTLVACGVFVVGGTFVWLVELYLLPLWLGYDSFAPLVPIEVLTQVEILVYGLSVLVVGALCYIGFLQYGHTLQSRRMAQAMVADLELSARQLQLLYDNSPVPYFVMDDGGNLRNANKATLRFFGASIGDIQVANVYNLIRDVRRGETSESIALLMSKVQRGVPVNDEEVHFRTYDDQERIARISIYSLDKRSPMPYKHLVALHDITKERESEQVKTDFLLLASHQLRTPTTTIKWYADYLLESKSIMMSDEVREYLHEIYTANERMTDLIATLLTVSHIEMGTLAPEFAPASLSAIVDDILRELAPDIAKKKHVVNKEVTVDEPVVTDARMIRIAIHNLLTNAIKYTPASGTVVVRITRMPFSSTVAVSDSGYGIPLEEQDRIFSKMFRAKNAKKVSTSGTGLGLYLTKSFVEKLGGTITFTSTEGKGTTFTITLPNVAGGA
jgi:PAS domain S-box-containing protein